MIIRVKWSVFNAHLFLQELIVNERSFGVGESPTRGGIQIECGEKLHNLFKLSWIWRQVLEKTWRTKHIETQFSNKQLSKINKSFIVTFGMKVANKLHEKRQ